VSNDQRAVRISNILGGAFCVTAIGKLDDRISFWNFSIFGQPPGGTATAGGKAKFQRRIQRASINAGLCA